jgi:hypothetical protein
MARKLLDAIIIGLMSELLVFVDRDKSKPSHIIYSLAR